MGKTIALKLSKKEHEVITLLNEQGITNSQLLRAALRQYFENEHKASLGDHMRDTLLFTERRSSEAVSESVHELRQEIQKLWNQLEKNQKQVDNHIMNLQRQLYLLSRGGSLSKHTTDAVKLETMHDIHSEIDEFLKKHTSW